MLHSCANEKWTPWGVHFVRYAKCAINEGAQADIDTAITIENKWFSKCFATQDQKEGMQAFLEKRKATFINK